LTVGLARGSTRARLDELEDSEELDDTSDALELELDATDELDPPLSPPLPPQAARTSVLPSTQDSRCIFMI
jgi:hypothetical protein